MQETADEGVGNADNESTLLSAAPSAAVSTSDVGGDRNDKPSGSDLTFKDLMLGVIEMQLMKNQNSVPTTMVLDLYSLCTHKYETYFNYIVYRKVQRNLRFEMFVK